MVQLGRLHQMMEMQAKLNDLTFSKFGFQDGFLPMQPKTTRDCRPLTTDSFRDGDNKIHQWEQKHWWIQQYTLCAQQELVELELSQDDQNDAVEIIDIWHFIMSMILVSGMTYDELIETCERRISRDHEEDWDCFWHSRDGYDQWIKTKDEAIQALRKSLSDVVDAMPWKHWSKKTEVDLGNVQMEIIDCLWGWIDISQKYGLTKGQVHSVYVQKNGININRQESGTYGLNPKTEDDNKSIEI